MASVLVWLFQGACLAVAVVIVLMCVLETIPRKE